MKGLVLYERGKTEIREVEKPVCGESDIIIKVESAAICGEMCIFIMVLWISAVIRSCWDMNLPVRLQRWDQRQISTLK